MGIGCRQLDSSGIRRPAVASDICHRSSMRSDTTIDNATGRCGARHAAARPGRRDGSPGSCRPVAAVRHLIVTSQRRSSHLKRALAADVRGILPSRLPRETASQAVRSTLAIVPQWMPDSEADHPIEGNEPCRVDDQGTDGDSDGRSTGAANPGTTAPSAGPDRHDWVAGEPFGRVVPYARFTAIQ